MHMITLHVYDLVAVDSCGVRSSDHWLSRVLAILNTCLGGEIPGKGKENKWTIGRGAGLGLGGVFHSSVAVGGVEWAFGMCEAGSGVYTVQPPGSNPNFSKRCSFEIGPCHPAFVINCEGGGGGGGVSSSSNSNSSETFLELVHSLELKWQGSDYHFLRNNCNHFADEIVRELLLGPLSSRKAQPHCHPRLAAKQVLANHKLKDERGEHERSRSQDNGSRKANAGVTETAAAAAAAAQCLVFSTYESNTRWVNRLARWVAWTRVDTVVALSSVLLREARSCVSLFKRLHRLGGAVQHERSESRSKKRDWLGRVGWIVRCVVQVASGGAKLLRCLFRIGSGGDSDARCRGSMEATVGNKPRMATARRCGDTGGAKRKQEQQSGARKRGNGNDGSHGYGVDKIGNQEEEEEEAEAEKEVASLLRHPRQCRWLVFFCALASRVATVSLMVAFDAFVPDAAVASSDAKVFVLPVTPTPHASDAHASHKAAAFSPSPSPATVPSPPGRAAAAAAAGSTATAAVTHPLLKAFTRWDSAHFLAIARDGYGFSSAPSSTFSSSPAAVSLFPAEQESCISRLDTEDERLDDKSSVDGGGSGGGADRVLSDFSGTCSLGVGEGGSKNSTSNQVATAATVGAMVAEAEQKHAFYPLFPLLVRGWTNTVFEVIFERKTNPVTIFIESKEIISGGATASDSQLPSATLLSPPPSLSTSSTTFDGSSSPSPPSWLFVACAVLLSNTSFVVAAVALFQLGHTVHLPLDCPKCKDKGNDIKPNHGVDQACHNISGGGGGPFSDAAGHGHPAALVEDANGASGNGVEGVGDAADDDGRVALVGALLFCVGNPASVFFSTAYSESVFAAFTFSGLWLLEYNSAGGGYGSDSGLAVAAATCLLMGASLCRSNGALNALVFLTSHALIPIFRQGCSQEYGISPSSFPTSSTSVNATATAESVATGEKAAAKVAVSSSPYPTTTNTVTASNCYLSPPQSPSPSSSCMDTASNPVKDVRNSSSGNSAGKASNFEFDPSKHWSRNQPNSINGKEVLHEGVPSSSPRSSCLSSLLRLPSVAVLCLRLSLLGDRGGVGARDGGGDRGGGVAISYSSRICHLFGDHVVGGGGDRGVGVTIDYSSRIRHFFGGHTVTKTTAYPSFPVACLGMALSGLLLRLSLATAAPPLVVDVFGFAVLCTTGEANGDTGQVSGDAGDVFSASDSSSSSSSSIRLVGRTIQQYMWWRWGAQGSSSSSSAAAVGFPTSEGLSGSICGWVPPSVEKEDGRPDERTSRGGGGVYGRVQSTYWDVGGRAFSYWTPKQLPNFALAAPILLLTMLGVLNFYQRAATLISQGDDGNGYGGIELHEHGLVFTTTPGQKQHKTQQVLQQRRRQQDLQRRWHLWWRQSPYFLQWGALAAVALVWAHVQISTRLLAASCPALYWFMATALTNKKLGNSLQWFKCFVWKRKVLWWWLVSFGIAGPLLHSNALPWT